jgi:hypothetical protein
MWNALARHNSTRVLLVARVCGTEQRRGVVSDETPQQGGHGQSNAAAYIGIVCRRGLEGFCPEHPQTMRFRRHRARRESDWHDLAQTATCELLLYYEEYEDDEASSGRRRKKLWRTAGPTTSAMKSSPSTPNKIASPAKPSIRQTTRGLTVSRLPAVARTPTLSVLGASFQKTKPPTSNIDYKYIQSR